MDILSLKVLKSLRIPLPPLETQRAIVAEIEAEQRLVAANRELIARFERKIQAAIARVWGEGAESEGAESEGANTSHEKQDSVLSSAERVSKGASHETRDTSEGTNTRHEKQDSVLSSAERVSKGAKHETRDAREEDASVREQGEERQAVLDL